MRIRLPEIIRNDLNALNVFAESFKVGSSWNASTIVLNEGRVVLTRTNPDTRQRWNVVENPSLEQVRGLFSQTKPANSNLRGIIQDSTGNLYLWDAYQAEHDEFLRYLMPHLTGPDHRFEVEYRGGPEPVVFLGFDESGPESDQYANELRAFPAFKRVFGNCQIAQTIEESFNPRWYPVENSHHIGEAIIPETKIPVGFKPEGRGHYEFYIPELGGSELWANFRTREARIDSFSPEQSKGRILLQHFRKFFDRIYVQDPGTYANSLGFWEKMQAEGLVQELIFDESLRLRKPHVDSF